MKLKENKSILLTPQHLKADGLLLSLHILKSKQAIRFEKSEIDYGELRDSFSHLPQVVKEILFEFKIEIQRDTFKGYNEITCLFKSFQVSL